MAGSSNAFYGHRAILARFVGLPRERPILGYLQHGWMHGWCPWHDNEPFFTSLPYAIPKLMWSELDARMIREAGGKPVRAIGSPFLYLLKMRGYSAPPGDGSLLCFPHHSSEIGGHDTDWEEFAEFTSNRADGRRVTVCLHPLDYEVTATREALRRFGFEPVTNGSREDPKFLLRFADLVESHDAVILNRLGTALAYAAAMGRRVSIGGPIPGMTVNAANRRVEHEAELMADFQRRHYPELLGEGLSAAEAEDFGWRELGASSMLPKDELADALGWRGLTRVRAQAIAKAAWLRRATLGGR